VSDVEKLDRDFKAAAKQVLSLAARLDSACREYEQLGVQLGIAREQCAPGSVLTRRKLHDSLKLTVLRLLASLELAGYADAKRHFVTNGLRLVGAPVERVQP
jgi:hypothetical protein